MPSQPTPVPKPPNHPQRGGTADATPGGRSTPLPPSPVKRTPSPTPVSPLPGRKGGTPLPPSPIKRPGSNPGIASPPPIKKPGAPTGVKKPGAVRPPTPQKDKLLGMTLGKVTLLKKIGHGGMGDVYLGEHAMLQRSVAVKVLPRDFTGNAELLARFRREAVACARLEHPNIVQVYDIGNEGELWYIIMTFVDGRSFQDLLDETEGPLDPKEAVRIVADSARGLQVAHEAGIIHRDVKPGNVLLGKKGEVRITDFGLAHDQESRSLVTMPGTMMGTPHFMSPEQAEGRRADERSDIYALGVMLYYALTGQRPFVGESHMAVLYKHINDSPTPIRKLNPKVPEYLARVVNRCLAKRSDQRYKSCADLAKDLDAFLNGTYAQPPPEKAAPAAVRPPSASRGPLVAKTSTVHAAPAIHAAARRARGSRTMLFIVSLAAMIVLVGLLAMAIMKQQKDDGKNAPPEKKSGRAEPPPPATDDPPPKPAAPADEGKKAIEAEEREFAALEELARTKPEEAVAACSKFASAWPQSRRLDEVRALKERLEKAVARPDAPPPPVDPPAPREEGFEAAESLGTCCSRTTLTRFGSVVRAESASAQDGKPHRIGQERCDLAEVVLRFDIRWIAGDRLSLAARHLTAREAQAAGEHSQDVEVRLEDMLARNEWQAVEFSVGADGCTVRSNGKEATSRLGVKTAQAGRVGLVVWPGTILELRHWRIKVVRTADIPKPSPVSSADAASRAVSNLVEEIRSLASKGSHRDAREKFAQLMKDHPDRNDEIKAAAGAVYPSLMAEGWVAAWNGRDLNEFTYNNPATISVSGGVLKINNVPGSTALRLRNPPAPASGCTAEFRIAEWRENFGPGLIYGQKDRNNQRMMVLHPSNATLQEMQNGKFEPDVVIGYPAAEPKDRWVAVTIVVVGDQALFYLDGELVHRGAASKAQLGKDSGIVVTGARCEVRNLRMRTLR